MRELGDAVSPNQQEVIEVKKTHWDCDNPALSSSFALAEGA
jgi:hypothetical protein